MMKTQTINSYNRKDQDIKIFRKKHSLNNKYTPLKIKVANN